MNGWTLIASLHHRPGHATAVRLVSSTEQVDVHAWSHSDGWCEHCRTRRARRTTYLLRHVDGRLAQVGSTCLTEFTDRPNPIHARDGSEHSSGRAFGHSRSLDPVEHVDTVRYLAHVAQSVIDRGFVSSSSGSKNQLATWAEALASLDRSHPPSVRAERRAREAIDWLRLELPSDAALDTFERRLVLVLGNDRLTRRELPTAAAAIYAFHQHLRRRIAARKKAGAHLGESGDRLTTVLSVESVERIATPSGPFHRHFLTDHLGRHALWDSPVMKLSPGTHRLQVTIDEHQDGDHPVTVLKHCAST